MTAKVRRAGLALIALGASACATSPDPAEIDLGPDTTEIEGWLDAQGEWVLFPSKNLRRYDPYTRIDGRRCVALVNAMGATRTEIARYDGRRVVVVGEAVRWDALDDGPLTPILSKKYYKGDVVENVCLRDLVFVARQIRPR